MISYAHKGNGIVRLYVDGVLRAKAKFSSVEIRKKVTDAFIEAATRLSSTGDIYLDLKHYHIVKKKNLSSKHLVVDKPRMKIPEKETSNFIRPKAEYSNPSYTY